MAKEILNPLDIRGTNADKNQRVKHMFYDWSEEQRIIKQMQTCQRNYDLTKEVHPEVIDYLLWHAENSPSKQHEAYYDVYYSADRKVIDEISKYTWGHTNYRTPPATWRNTQANANMYMVFVAKEPETSRNCKADGSVKSNKSPARWENAYVSIGIAMGLVMRAANSLGLVTGCNKSHNDLNGDDFWEKKLGILEEVKAGTKKVAYGIGIGYPQEGRPRWESDDPEIMIGAGNGSRNTTDENMDVHPRTGKELRKVKIINIKEHGGETIKDYYGNEHVIPTKHESKINSFRKRIINIKEIN